MTDGLENSSREYTKQRIAEMTKVQRETYHWQFVYLGADQDAMEVGTGIGSAAALSASYSKKNFSKAMTMSSRKLAAFRSSGHDTDLNYDDKDRKDLIDPGKS